MKKISVIIPCYNVEKYINKCLDSVLNNTLKDIEVIVINDGSTDNTLNLLKQYKDDRIILIDKENAGVAMARNDGIKKATGEYITFIDSDDYIDSNAYEKMYNKAKKFDLDLIACDAKMVYSDHDVIIPSKINDDSTNKDLMINAYAVIWNKLYKKELIKDLEFTKGINLCEDVEFLYKIYPRVKRVGSISQPFYNYIQRPNSLTYVYDEKIYHAIKVADRIIEYYKKNNIYDEYREELEYTYIRYTYGTFIKRLAKTKDKKKYNEGVKFAKEKVLENFPNYKKNKYINNKTGKSMYFKHFNKLIANIIFYKERNRLN